MLAFIHIPKSAGTSIVNWIADSTDNKLLVLERDWFAHVTDPADVDNTNIVFGHFSHDTAQFLQCNSLAFFMRNPLTRVVSQVADWQYKQKDAIESDLTSRYRKVIDPMLSFEASLISLLESQQDTERFLDISNAVAYQLGGHVYERSISIDDVVTQSLKNIESAEFVGVYEKMQASIEQLAQMLHIDAARRPIARHNEGRVNTSHLLNSLKRSTIDLIKKYNEADFFLYEQAVYAADKQCREIKYFDLSTAASPIVEENRAAQAASDILSNYPVSTQCTFSQRFLQVIGNVFHWNRIRSGLRDIAIVNGCSAREYFFYEQLATPPHILKCREKEHAPLPTVYEPLLDPVFDRLISPPPAGVSIASNLLIARETWNASALKSVIDQLAGPETIIVLGQTIMPKKPINVTALNELLNNPQFPYSPAALIDGHIYLTPRRIKSAVQDIIRAKLNGLELLRGNVFGHSCLVAVTDY